VSNSVLKILLNAFVDPAANLKYSLVESLFFSNDSVNDSALLLIFFKLALNLPVALIEFIKFCCKSACAFAAAPVLFDKEVLNRDNYL